MHSQTVPALHARACQHPGCCYGHDVKATRQYPVRTALVAV